MSLLRKSNNSVSSRLQINIEAVEDGIMELKDKQYRAILKSSSINFELKSEMEQDAVTETYQSVLNSLTCPIQIMVCIREMDLDKYLEKFEAARRKEKLSIYRKQITAYIEFVTKLVKKNKILSRHFYIVVPYKAKDDEDFSLAREQLLLNVDIISKGLARLGMKSQRLSSLELLDFFYGLYNPRQAKTQPITDHAVRMLQEVNL
jgi:hypothetical protein